MNRPIRIFADALASVRERHAFYVGSSAHSRRAVITSGMVCDAMALDAGPIQVDTNLKPWTLISGSRNWIVEGLEEPLSIEEVFRGLWPFPALGVHSTRHEIYALAFAAAVFVWDGKDVLILSGERPPQEVLDVVCISRFAVGFRVDRD